MMTKARLNFLFKGPKSASFAFPNVGGAHMWRRACLEEKGFKADALGHAGTGEDGKENDR